MPVTGSLQPTAVIAGTVTVAEARRGRIDHALALNIPNACAGRFSWPAQRTDGTLTTSTCLPEGARLRFDPNLDLSKLNMPPFTRMLAEAAQDHGIIVRDKTLSNIGFSVEDPAQYPVNPWYGSAVWPQKPGADSLFGGHPWELVHNQFPWGSLQLLDMDLCTTGPCASVPG